MVNVSPFDAMMLPDLSDEAPSGVNLELDAQFGALERAAQGKPETQYGNTITPATPPDWKETEAHALVLLDHTRDLRVLTHLAVARLNLSGVPAFAEVLGQIRWQLENRWQQVHPQLDPEDGNDPTLRGNALFQLQDPVNVLRTLRDLPLARTVVTGPISWRDIAIFNGQLEPEPGHAKLTEAFIRGAFTKTDPARLGEFREGVDRTIQEVAAIPAAFEAQAGPGTGPDFANLAKLLLDIQKELRRFEVAVVTEAVANDTEESSELAEATSAPRRQPAPRGAITPRSITAITEREDALYLLDLASMYFRTNEPSSPLPMLIDRARRLATMEFLDILRDLAPEGLTQAQIVAGPPAEPRG